MINLKQDKIVYLYWFIVVSVATAIIWVIKAKSLSLEWVTSVHFIWGLITFIFVKYIDRKSILDLGFRVNKNTLKAVALGFLFPVVTIGLLYIVMLVLKAVEIEPGNPGWAGNNLQIIWFLFFDMIIGTFYCLIGEELTFRGYILKSLTKTHSVKGAILISSILFGLMHIPYYFFLSTEVSSGVIEKMVAIPIIIIMTIISSIPIAIMYPASKDLYGISLYHSLVDEIQDKIIGIKSERAKPLWLVTTQNELVESLLSIGYLIVTIPLMAYLCKKIWGIEKGDSREKYI